MHDEEMRVALGKRLFAARQAKGWTIYELAERTGLGETHLKKLEQGAYSCRVDILEKVCKALEIEVTIPLAK